MCVSLSNFRLLRRVLWINAELTIVSSLKHKNTQAIYIFNRDNPKNSEPQYGFKEGTWFHSFGCCYPDRALGNHHQSSQECKEQKTATNFTIRWNIFGRIIITCNYLRFNEIFVKKPNYWGKKICRHWSDLLIRGYPASKFSLTCTWWLCIHHQTTMLNIYYPLIIGLNKTTG